jgi:transcriptional regulator with XRE-family HTH domain
MGERRGGQRVRRQPRLVADGPDKHEMEDLMLAFGRNLRTARTAAKLSQEALAVRCFMHRAQMWEIESGRRSPAVPALLLLADRLNVPVNRLLDGTEAPIRRHGTAQVLNAITHNPGIKQSALPVLLGLPDRYVTELTLHLQSVGAIALGLGGWRPTSKSGRHPQIP